MQVVKAAEKERRKEKQPMAALAAKPFPPFRKPGGAEETWEAAAGGGIRTGPGGVHRSAPAGRPAVFSQAPALLDDTGDDTGGFTAESGTDMDSSAVVEGSEEEEAWEDEADGGDVLAGFPSLIEALSLHNYSDISK